MPLPPVISPPTGPVGSDQNRIVVYKGPLAEAIDDWGTRFPRGARVGVSSEQWEELGRSAAAPQFLFVNPTSEDLDHSGFGGDGHGMPQRPESIPAPLMWSHLSTARPPRRIPYDDETLDEVLLEGTFNANLRPESLHAVLTEARRALKRGGRISVHGLVSDVPFPGKPSLPGPAAMVRSVPVETEPLRRLRLAGFVGMFYERLGDIHCFRVDGIELRELQLVGFKPFSDDDGATRYVMYRGPLSYLIDDGGRPFHRGYRVAVDTATWQLYRRPPFDDQFICFPCAPQSPGAETD